MSSKRISIILLLIIVFLLILFLMCKMNHKHSKNEHFNQVIKKSPIYKLYDVFKFLKDLKLPKEMEARYAYTLKAKNPRYQVELENEIATLLDKKFILDEDDLKNITENPKLELDNNGLIQSIDYYRAVIDFIKVTDAVNDFKKKVRDGLVNGYNQQ